MVSRISAVASLLMAVAAETKRLGTLIRELLARQDTSELDRFRSAGCATIGSVRIARCPQQEKLDR